MTLPTPHALAETRASWHRVAEHVLAAGQFAAAGTIRLRPWPGGFATAVGIDGRRLAVVGDQLVVEQGDAMRSQPLTTLAAVAAFAGVRPGLSGSYTPVTSADPDAPLVVDPAAALLMADWFSLGDAALRRFAVGAEVPAVPVLWPEHFDLAITLDAVNYGASPGDDAIPGPYLYVGPHGGPPSRDDYWNAPFGAAATADRIRTAADAVDFFHQGRSLLSGGAT
jgi:hypothetical protein